MTALRRRWAFMFGFCFRVTELALTSGPPLVLCATTLNEAMICHTPVQPVLFPGQILTSSIAFRLLFSMSKKARVYLSGPAPDEQSLFSFGDVATESSSAE